MQFRLPSHQLIGCPMVQPCATQLPFWSEYPELQPVAPQVPQVVEPTEQLCEPEPLGTKHDCEPAGLEHDWLSVAAPHGASPEGVHDCVCDDAHDGEPLGVQACVVVAAPHDGVPVGVQDCEVTSVPHELGEPEGVQA